MKSLVIIVSIFLFTEIQKSHGRELNAKRFPDGKRRDDTLNAIQTMVNDLGIGVKGSLIEAKRPDESPESFKARLAETKEKAFNDQELAIHNARQAYEEARDKAETLLQEEYEKFYTSKDNIDQKLKKAEMIAAAVLRYKMKQSSDIWDTVKDEYEQLIAKSQQKRKDAVKEREAAMQAADEKFGKMYNEIEKNKLDAENKYKDILEAGQIQYENAKNAAEKRKNQAEKEFLEIGKQNSMSTEEWDEVQARYDAEMEAYEKSLELAQKEWQEVLDKTGIGKQYEEALDKAFNELLEGQALAKSLAYKLLFESDECKEKAEELKENIERRINADQEKYQTAYEAAVEKAKKEHKNAMRDIQKVGEKENALVNTQMKKAQDEFDKVRKNADREYGKIVQEVERMINNLENTAAPAQTVPGRVVEGRIRRNQSQTRRQSNGKNRIQIQTD